MRNNWEGRRPNKEQQKVLHLHGLPPDMWLVLKELPHSLIVTHRYTEEIQVLEK